MDLEAVEVADDQQWRIFEVFTVLEELLVGGIEVFVFALVFPSKEAAHPDVGEAFAAGNFVDSFFEGVGIAFLIDFGGGRLAENFAEVDEMLLGAGALGEGGALPAGYKLGDSEGGHVWE